MRFVLAEIDYALLKIMQDKKILFPHDTNQGLGLLEQKKNNLCVLASNEECVLKENMECLLKPEELYKYERYVSEMNLKQIMTAKFRFIS